jgi:hypothetical protein
MANELKLQFGDRVEVKYVDVDKEGLDNYPFMSRVLQMGYPYPITLINGEPKFPLPALLTAEVVQSIEGIIKNLVTKNRVYENPYCRNEPVFIIFLTYNCSS